MVYIFEAIDRINVGENFLSVYPLKLIFGPCEIALNGSVYVNCDACLVINEISYNKFLKLLLKLLQYFSQFRHEKAEKKTVTQSEKELVFCDQISKVIVNTDSIIWKIVTASQNELVVNEENLLRLVKAVYQLLFKSYCYNTAVYESLNSFIFQTSIETLHNIKVQCDSVFSNFNVNSFYLKELVYRHEEIIIILKKIMMPDLKI